MDPGVDVAEEVIEQGLCVPAGAFATVFELEYGLDLGEGETGGLAVANESEPIDGIWRVVAVAGGGAGVRA